MKTILEETHKENGQRMTIIHHGGPKTKTKKETQFSTAGCNIKIYTGASGRTSAANLLRTGNMMMI